MGKETGIEWCDHTFNPWWGCVEISPACDHCYAREQSHRFGKAKWGKDEARVRTSAAYWRQPLKWDRAARADGRRVKVFCGSMMDVGEHAPGLAEMRADLFRLMEQTTNTDWLLLTKRPTRLCEEVRNHNVADLFRRMVWAGTTVENQAMADARIPRLLEIPAAKRFLSCEPLLGPVDLLRVKNWFDPSRTVDVLRFGTWDDAAAFGFVTHSDMCSTHGLLPISWVIAGGESGRNARRHNPEWFRFLRDQCRDADVPYFFKQWGEFNEQGERVGKRKSGALLDGVEHKEFPA